MISKSIVCNRNRIKITYREGKKKWYAELTRSNMKKGYGWFQWGTDRDTLYRTVDSTERLVNQWIEEYL